MRSIAFADFLIGVGILFVLEGLMFAASPAWMRRAMKSALATPDNILRIVGIVSAACYTFLGLGGYIPVAANATPIATQMTSVRRPARARYAAAVSPL